MTFSRAMRMLTFLLAGLAGCCMAQSSSWALPNFSSRLDVNVSNPADYPVHTLAIIPVREASRVASGFPGVTAVAVLAEPLTFLPSQIDDLDGDGQPDEVVFPVNVPAHGSITASIYYSSSLKRSIPWPQRVSASHSFGYNTATAALESEAIGYRTYGGFFLDVQARAANHPGLFNELVGLKSPSLSPNLPIGRDVLHIGDTLGLGGIFMRSGNSIFRPPLNVPDYAHKAELAGAPTYRVIATGPVRAVIEARMDNWQIGNDTVRLRALYSIAAESEVVTCTVQITPVHVTRSYEVGAGVLHLPKGEVEAVPGRIFVTGEQSRSIGAIGLSAAYATQQASPAGVLKTGEGENEAFVFRQKFDGKATFCATYHLAAAWSGSGIANLKEHLAESQRDAANQLVVSGYSIHQTPSPDRIEGEPR